MRMQIFFKILSAKLNWVSENRLNEEVDGRGPAVPRQT